MKNSKALKLINELMQIHPKGYDLSLGRISQLLEKLGDPQNKLPPIIHVAGTNGKGSTIAFCRAMLEADGKIVHVDTSPHLINYHERFRLGAKGGGKFVSDEVFAEALTRVAKANGGEPITVFEILTAVMFLLFSEHPADVALVEVGLGGRFDSTNVIKQPKVSIVTPISLDHESFLGDAVDKIAFEKAGIIKPSCQVVIAMQDDASRAVLEERAGQIGAPIAIGGQDYSCHEERGRLVYQDEYGLLDLPAPKLVGYHQIINAATAIAALRYGGFDVSDRAIEAGVKNVSWPGRLQQLKSGALLKFAPEGSELWADGGHNPNAGEAISAFMGDLRNRDHRKLVLVFGMLSTKDPEGYIKEFVGLADKMYTVPITSSEAGVDPEVLAITARDAGLDAVAIGSVRAALNEINTGWKDDLPPRILFCGTLYLVGDVLEQNKTPPE